MALPKILPKTLSQIAPKVLDESRFVTVWDTTKAGSASTTVIIPLVSGQTYNGSVDWGDGSIETFNSSSLTNLTHIYSSSGIYTVKISGAFPRILFANGGDRLKLIDITSWGLIEWSSMLDAFFGCENLTGSFTDTPDLSAVTTCQRMFRSCSLLNADLSNWDMSTITTINSMFLSCSVFTSNLSSWDVSSVTNMAFAFSSASVFDSDLSHWQIQNVLSFASWFSSAALSTANYDLMLNAYSLLSVDDGTAFGVGATTYTIATSQAARDVLDNAPNNWTITDGGGV